MTHQGSARPGNGGSLGATWTRIGEAPGMTRQSAWGASPAWSEQASQPAWERFPDTDYRRGREASRGRWVLGDAAGAQAGDQAGVAGRVRRSPRRGAAAGPARRAAAR